jgi:phage gpG-like protein
MEAIGEVARASVDQNFATGGRPPWPHIKDATHEPLIKSGHLRASIEVVASDSDKIVDIGSDVDYAPYHQYGTSHIPARAFLELQSSDEKRIEDLLARHLAL